jgi:hypothetical protein
LVKRADGRRKKEKRRKACGVLRRLAIQAGVVQKNEWLALPALANDLRSPKADGMVG